MTTSSAHEALSLDTGLALITDTEPALDILRAQHRSHEALGLPTEPLRLAIEALVRVQQRVAGIAQDSAPAETLPASQNAPSIEPGAGAETSTLPWSDDTCPSCSAPVVGASGGGVVCSARCGWWFCW